MTPRTEHRPQPETPGPAPAPVPARGRGGSGSSALARPLVQSSMTIRPLRSRANVSHHSFDLRVRDQYARVTQRRDPSSTVRCSRMCRRCPASSRPLRDVRVAGWP
jgi:hypothetical protein